MQKVKRIKIDQSKIRTAIQAGIPLSITTYTLPMEMAVYIEDILKAFLKELNQEQMFEGLSYCVKELTNNAKKAYYEDSNVNPTFSKFLDQFDYTAIVGISKDGDTATILANSDTGKTISNIIEYYDDDCIKKIGNDTQT